jgi:hypothetical protein
MNISPWVLILGGAAIAYFIDRRFRKIETFINIPESSAKAGNALSYRASVYVCPDWFKLIRWCFPNLETDDEVIDFAQKLHDDAELKLDEELGMFQKEFRFVEFYDGVSGLNTIWSNEYKRFLDELEVSGRVFHEGVGRTKSLATMFPDNPITRNIVVSPYFIGFRSNLPDGDMGDEDKPSQFPYRAVIDFFTNIQKYSETIWGGNLMVKKFSPYIQDQFDKFQVEYDPWDYEDYGTGVEGSKELEKSRWLKKNGIELYKQKMRSHTFKTPYFTVTMALRFFSVEDR